MIFQTHEFHIGGSIHHQEQLHWHREARDRKSYGTPLLSSAITIHTLLITRGIRDINSDQITLLEFPKAWQNLTVEKFVS